MPVRLLFKRHMTSTSALPGAKGKGKCVARQAHFLWLLVCIGVLSVAGAAPVALAETLNPSRLHLPLLAGPRAPATPTSPTTPTVPSTPTAPARRPAPIDVAAGDLALAPADLPAYYRKETDQSLEAGSPDVAGSVIRTYVVEDTMALTEPARIESVVVVYWDEAGSKAAFEESQDAPNGQPGWRAEATESLGDAMVAASTDNYAGLTAYLVLYREDNILAYVLVGGEPDIVKLEQAESYARLMHAKIAGQR